MSRGKYWAASHYTVYHRLSDESRAALALRSPLRYVSGRRLERLNPGDVLWLVNVHLGRLYLLGRLLVEFVVDDPEIALDLAGSEEGEWPDADWYALANRHTVEPLRELEITHLATTLHFENRQPRLTVYAGKIARPQELRPLRRLARETAQTLEDLWYGDAYAPETLQDYLELTEDDQAYAEGRVIVRTVKQRQRSRQLVQDAKERFRSQYGRLFCEVCGFDFTEAYGIEYIEAHHGMAMAALDEDHLSKTEDLVMLCANCHRAVHSQIPPLSIDALRQRLRIPPQGGE